jgi:LPXTG-site transpeptidase (sortase) family protein
MLTRSLLALTVALAILLAWSLSGPLRTPAPPTCLERRSASGERIAALPPRLRSFAALAKERRATRTGPRVDAHAAPPRRISIPAIGVDAPVIALGLTPDGTLQTPRQWGDAGWYEPGPEPGEQGAAVIAGHVDSTTGPAVFYRLRALRSGDLIGIHRADGSVIRFRVRRLERWPKSEFPTRRVYGHTHGAVLRLITCSGGFNRSTRHYLDNTIVYASRV